MVYPVAEGAAGLARALEGLQAAASQAIAGGHNILNLSDRGISRERAAIPSLLEGKDVLAEATALARGLTT